MRFQKQLIIGGAVILTAGLVRSEVRDISQLLGATHMNPLYNFTTAPVMEEGADVLRHMGSGAIKMWYGPDYAVNYPQNHSWPSVSNLTELAQTEYFSTMFADPDFSTYSLEMATFGYRTAWKNGLVGYESNSISAEVYSFATHLLDTYNDSGKTFILQNWEGDNNLGENADPVKVQGMIDWMNCWQDAITAARNDSTSSNVWVYGAAECNKVGQPDWEGPRCITDVFPYLRMDLYSYSDWYTRYEEDLLLEDLNNIKRYAPDSDTFGHENVMLGEFGLNRNAVDGEAGNLLSSRTEFEIGMDVGARYAFYWCVYDTNTNKSHGLVLNKEHADEFGLPVDHTGRYFTQTHNYFKTNALTLDVFEDLGADFNECVGQSNMMVTNDVVDEFDNDPSRFIRVDQNQAGVLDYAFDRDVQRLAIMGYEEPGRVTSVAVSASKNGASGSYVDIPLRKVINDVYDGNTFRRMLHKNVDPIPSGYRYIQVTVDSNIQRSPQIGSIRFYLKRPPVVQTIEFGGLVSHLTNETHQAQVGADELVQWNGVDSWGGSFGLNGTLHNAETNAFLTSPATGLRLTTSHIYSTDAEGTNTFTSGGILGIKGGDHAKFDAANSEGFSIHFDRAVILKQLILSALQYNGETAEVTIMGEVRSFNRTDLTMTPAGWDANRFIYTFDPPLDLAAATDIQIEATQGQWGLEGVVVRTGPLTSPYDLWADMNGLQGTDSDWFADPDGNGMNNQLDYSLGGNAPVSGLVQAGESNLMQMVYQRRRDAEARGLHYQMLWTDNLISNVWSSAGTRETGTLTVDESFEMVTNQVPAALPSMFMRLEIEDEN